MKEITVLIVDDQAFVRQMMRRALVGIGAYKVLEASDGLDAIRLMRDLASNTGSVGAGTDLMAKPQEGKARIDCIVSDINMLPMNGLEFVKAIRVGLAPIPRNTPVIMLTGHAEKHFLAAAIALDANGFLVKPVSASVFHQKIDRAVMTKAPSKPAEEYALLIVPDIEAKDLWSSTAAMKKPDTAPVRAADLAGQGRKQLPVAVAPSDLQVGDRLAEDLLTDEGILVVPNGSRVAQALILAIQDLSEVVTLQAQVSVFRS